MRAGELRERITIQARTVARNSYGEEVPTWSTHATVWASVEPLTGAEFYESTQERATIQARIRIRYRTDIVPEMRVTHAGSTYDIHAVVHSHSDHRQLQLLCRRVV